MLLTISCAFRSTIVGASGDASAGFRDWAAEQGLCGGGGGGGGGGRMTPFATGFRPAASGDSNREARRVHHIALL